MSDEPMKALVEHYALTENDRHYIGIMLDRVRQEPIGPFATVEERDRAFADLLDMMRMVGAVDLPSRPQ